MRKQTLCFLVLGASLSMLMQNLAKRRTVVAARPVTRTGGGQVIDLAAWKELRDRDQLAVSAK